MVFACPPALMLRLYYPTIKKAIFLGQETGGGYQGNTSGMMPEMKVTDFDFIITVPLQKYTNQVDPFINRGRGTLLDHPIELTPRELLERKDKELEFTLELIKARKHLTP